MENTSLNPKIIIAVSAGAIIILGIFGFGIFQYSRISGELASLKAHPEKLVDLNQTEQKKVLSGVGKLMELPTDEEPTVATVSDVEKLRNQAFFAKAQNGDKVIIFSKNRKAILYRPSTNKIIDVSVISLNTASPSASLAEPTANPSKTLGASTRESPLKIYMLNGTNVNNLSKAVEESLKNSFSNFEISGRDFAGKKDYEKTLVVSLSLKKAPEAKKIADILNANVVNLPESEINPNNTDPVIPTDILVIIGNDKTVTPSPSL